MLINEGEGGQIRFSALQGEDEKEYVINYFKCTPGVSDKDCKALQSTFSQNSPRSITTSNGITYYKSNLTNSRFANNNNRWGIMINDTPEDVIKLLKDDILLVNDKTLHERVKSAAPRLCQQNDEKLQSITKTDYLVKNEGLVANIIGKSQNYEISCSILIDLGLPAKGKISSFSIGKTINSEPTTGTSSDNVTQQQTSENKVVSQISWNPNVPQFPINIEKSLTYKSSRGYGAILPSPNLSYAANAVNEDF